MSRETMAIWLLVAAVALGVPQTSKANQSLTGRWEVDADRADASGEPAFGAAFTAAQSAAGVIIDFDVMRPGGRGVSGLVRHGVHLVYAFDGSETNEVTIRMTGSTTRTVDTAQWIDGRLDIQTTTFAASGKYISKKSIRFEDDRTVVVDTSRGGTWPEAVETRTRTYYRKVS